MCPQKLNKEAPNTGPVAAQEATLEGSHSASECSSVAMGEPIRTETTISPSSNEPLLSEENSNPGESLHMYSALMKLGKLRAVDPLLQDSERIKDTINEILEPVDRRQPSGGYSGAGKSEEQDRLNGTVVGFLLRRLSVLQAGEKLSLSPSYSPDIDDGSFSAIIRGQQTTLALSPDPILAKMRIIERYGYTFDGICKYEFSTCLV